MSCAALQANALIIDLEGAAAAMGFAERPTGFNGTPVPGPFDPLSAQFTLSYDDTLAPFDGALNAMLTSLSLSIGGVTYDISNSSAFVQFTSGALVGVAVGGNANGGPDSLSGGTDDFLFSNISGIQLFQYTAANVPGTITGLFETLFVPGPDPDIGDVTVSFGPAAAVASPATLALLLLGAVPLLGGRARPGREASPA